MRYVINKEGRPAYIQLYEQIRDDVIRGVYPYGKKLPSKRITASELGISTVTVEHAYSLLCEEGYVEPRERSGYFVIFRNTDYFGMTSNIRRIVTPHRNDENTPTRFPISVLSKAMRKVISDYGEEMLIKPPNRGSLELREVLSEYLFRSRGITASTDRIIIGSGAEYLYSLIVGLMGHERVFALEYPSYEKIEQVYASSGAVCRRLPICSDGIDSSALAFSDADVLHISPYRSYPTGVTASASKKHEYIRWAEKGDRYIVEDDFESEFSISKKSEETLFALSERDNVIYLNTFSMTVSPAMRIGYMVLPEKLSEKFSERLEFLSCTVPAFEQYLLCELIRSGDFERHINRVRRNKRRGASH